MIITNDFARQNFVGLADQISLFYSLRSVMANRVATYKNLFVIMSDMNGLYLLFSITR